jgi:hypothetical protein
MYRKRVFDTLRQGEDDLRKGKIDIQYKTRSSMYNEKNMSLRRREEKEMAIGLKSKGESHVPVNKHNTTPSLVKQTGADEKSITHSLYDRNLITQVKQGYGPAYKQFKDRIDTYFVPFKSLSSNDTNTRNHKLEKWTRVKVEERKKEKELEEHAEYMRKMGLYRTEGFQKKKRN